MDCRRLYGRLGVVFCFCLMVAVCVSARMRVNPHTTLHCHLRQYTYQISKPYTSDDGVVLECFQNVTVMSCWGRCDSSEVADYQVPYKISRHPVCTYSGRSLRSVHLEHCPTDHPDPTTKVFDALGCSCAMCTADETSCEYRAG